MTPDNNPMTVAKGMLAKIQKKYSRVPKRRERREIADLIITTSGLQDDPREYYCRLLILSALAGQEQFYANWDRSKLHAKRNGRSRQETITETLERWERSYRDESD